MLFCPYPLTEETLGYLRQAGTVGVECIVLWLGYREGQDVRVACAYRPEQTARRNRFVIPPQEMTKIMALLREHRWMIAAQVHSHPFDAFHSEANDEGAIVRHEGALSFVVPWFAASTNAQTFLHEVALYCLQAGDRWVEVPEKDLACKIEF